MAWNGDPSKVQCINILFSDSVENVPCKVNGINLTVVSKNDIWVSVPPLQWRRDGNDGVSNHQPHGCLLNRLFRRNLKKTPNGDRFGKTLLYWVAITCYSKFVTKGIIFVYQQDSEADYSYTEQQAWGLLRQCLPFRYFSHLSSLSKQTLTVKYRVYTWQKLTNGVLVTPTPGPL